MGPDETPAESEPSHLGIADARRLYDQIIALVENVMLGRDSGWEWAAAYWENAEKLLAFLKSIQLPLDDRLTFFRDCVVGADDGAAEAWGELGLPIRRADHDDAYFDVDLGLARQWLVHMRDLGETLRHWRISPSRRRRSRNGGRPKSKAVLALQKAVAQAFAEEREHLQRNGQDVEAVRESLLGFSTLDILRRINDARRERGLSAYPLNGDKAARYRKQVQRSPAWWALHSSVAIPGACDRGQVLTTEWTESVAAANGLTVRQRRPHSSGQNRQPRISPHVSSRPKGKIPAV